VLYAVFTFNESLHQALAAALHVNLGKTIELRKEALAARPLIESLPEVI
jgi:hypothetical protein